MKYLTLALFLGYVSASETIHDAINALKIEVSQKGQEEIQKELHDVERVAKRIENAKPVKKLEHSLKQFAHTKQIAHIKQIDEKFMKSPLGKKMVKEWTDVGKVLQENLHADKDGVVHFPNDKMDELSAEVEDVGDTYDRFFQSRWAKKYEAGWKAAFETEEAHQVQEDLQGFKHSHAGHRFKRQVKQLKHAIHKNVKVTDIPEEWKDSESMLKFEVTPEGEKQIEKELTDVARQARKVAHTKPARQVKRSLKRWAHSPQVKALKKLDHEFLKTEQGQKLLKEWREFGHALKTHIHRTKRGIQIDSDSFQVIHDESEDVAQELEKLKHSEWGAKYDRAWKNATSTPQAHRVGKKLQRLSKTKQWHKLEKELKDLDQSIRKNVKVTDVPENALTNNLKIEINEDGVNEIEEDLKDIEETWKEIEDSQPVQNVGEALQDLGQTAEAQKLGQLNQEFAQSPEGQQLNKEVTDFFEALDQHIKETDGGIEIDNEALDIIEAEADDIDAEFKKLEQSHWAQDYDQAFNELGQTEEAAKLGQTMQEFEQSEEGQQFKEELEELDKDLEEYVEVTDIPEDMEMQTVYMF